MKVSMRWLAVLLMTGSAMAGSAIAGPVMGPYGIWNSGGAYGSFGPYQRGCGLQERVILREAPRRVQFAQTFNNNRVLAPVAEQVTIEKCKNMGRRNLVQTKQVFTETRITQFRPKRTLWKQPVVAERIIERPAIVAERVVERPAVILENAPLSDNTCNF